VVEISIRALRKTFGRTEIIRDLDLDIRDGEFIVVLGPSGCGKSTLLRLIAGLEEATGGEIRIGTTVVNRLEPRERGCAMVFQNYALYPHMTVAENIGYALKVAGMGKRERMEKVHRVAETLGLSDYLDRKPAALSGGQRQRVAMGRAMIRDPRVFLFDEPLSNLDAKLRVQMRVEIRRLHRRLKATSVFVTHDQIEAMTLADRLVVMNGGRIEQIGAPAEVYRAPASLFVAGFIGSPAMNLMPGRRTGPDLIELAGGAGLRLPRSAVPVPQGPALVLGFRPEEAVIAEKPGPDTLPFSVEMIEEIGTGRLLHGRIAETEAVIVLPVGARTVASGATVAFRVPETALHLFDANTGLRMDSPPLTLAAE
jgi:sn-glycerol 3-phosphate transport system ATP-binding protein